MLTSSVIRLIHNLRGSYSVPIVLLGLVCAALLGAAQTSLAADPTAERLIVADQQCNAGGQVKVSFSWQTAYQGDQWLDLSRTPDNFASGALMSVGPLTSQQTTTDSDWLLARTAYYVRVNTQTENGWSASSTLSFSTRACEVAAAASTGGGGGDSSGDGGGGDGGSGGGGGGSGGGY
jgi:hypothetical protein